MGTDIKKNESIKIRVSKEQKELFKDVATKKGISLTDLLIVSTNELIQREKLKEKEIEIIEPRLSILEKELKEVKARMEKRQKATKKNKFNW